MSGCIVMSEVTYGLMCYNLSILLHNYSKALIILLISNSVKLEDDQMDEESEELAFLLAAQGVIGKRVDQMESGFMMALDYMIQLAEKDQDDKVIFVNSRYLSFCISEKKKKKKS